MPWLASQWTGSKGRYPIILPVYASLHETAQDKMRTSEKASFKGYISEEFNDNSNYNPNQGSPWLFYLFSIIFILYFQEKHHHQYLKLWKYTYCRTDTGIWTLSKHACKGGKGGGGGGTVGSKTPTRWRNGTMKMDLMNSRKSGFTQRTSEIRSEKNSPPGCVLKPWLAFNWMS